MDGSRWDGKIRLIGFVDVFVLFCYSGESRFEKGIIIYSNPSSVYDKFLKLISTEDDVSIRNILRDANVTAAELDLEVVNENEIKYAQEKGRGKQSLI